MRLRPWLALLVGLVCSVADADAVSAQAWGVPPPRRPTEQLIGPPEVRSVEFVGNETFPSDSLAGAIVTRATECRPWLLAPVCWAFGWAERTSTLRDRDVPLDAQRIQRWYQMRGFREAQVDAETTIEDDQRVVVRFSIREGTPILADSIGYAVPDGFVVGNLLDDVPISPGDRWNTLALDATRDTLVRRLRNRGYPYADVLRQTVLPRGEPYGAHVVFEIEPGTYARYGPIRVDGIDHLDESTVSCWCAVCTRSRLGRAVR
jgi:outer membrane protein assembly factor BamA